MKNRPTEQMTVSVNPNSRISSEDDLQQNTEPSLRPSSKSSSIGAGNSPGMSEQNPKRILQARTDARKTALLWGTAVNQSTPFPAWEIEGKDLAMTSRDGLPPNSTPSHELIQQISGESHGKLGTAESLNRFEAEQEEHRARLKQRQELQRMLSHGASRGETEAARAP